MFKFSRGMESDLRSRYGGFPELIKAIDETRPLKVLQLLGEIPDHTLANACRVEIEAFLRGT